MARSSEPGRSTTSRLFAVLGAFSRARPVMTLTQVAGSSGLPIATAHRLLRELTAYGAVERTPDGRYQIGVRLWEIGSLAPRHGGLRRIAGPVVRELRDTTSETVQLAVPTDGGALVVERLTGARRATDVTEIGAVLPWHATAVGKILLGFGPQEVLEGVAGRRLRGFTASTITDGRRLRAERATVLRERIAYSRGELTPGTASAAAPVFDADGRLAAAVGVLTSSVAALPRLAPAVRSASLAISERLRLHGAGDGPPRAAAER